jgi:hypothetical protein
MAYPPVNFDVNLEHIVTVILNLTLAHPLALALSQSFVNTFIDDFRTIDIDDVYEFRYHMTTDPVNTPGTKLHVTVVKKIQRMVSYARCKEENKDKDCDTPDIWDTDIYSKWCRNGYANYPTSLTASVTGSTAAATSTLATATTAAFVTTAQKDDDAALISWNRKPRDVGKYPLLKNDADYQDWKLKMKRQLIADTLSRVTEPTFRISTCRSGADTELAKLQINFFEQNLSAVLLNPEGKGLIITHPEDALFVWNKHEAHQLDSDSAQISTTAQMTKLMALKIADSPSRHSFLVSFQEVCNRYDQLTNVRLEDTFKRTLLQASIMHNTALLNSWNTVNEVTAGIPLMR